MNHVKKSVIMVVAAVMTATMTVLAVLAEEYPPWSFVVMGDTRSNGTLIPDPGVNPDVQYVAQAIADFNTDTHIDFVISPGDLIIAGYVPEGSSITNYDSIAQMYTNWQQGWSHGNGNVSKGMSPVYKAGIPVYPIRGNHETKTKEFLDPTTGKNYPDNDPQPYLDAFKSSLIANGIGADSCPSDAAYLSYSFTHKNAMLICVDEYLPGFGNDLVPSVKDQQKWIDTQLAGSQTKKLRPFVFGHAPFIQLNIASVLTTQAYRDSTIDPYTSPYDFFTSLCNAGCLAYFCGHDHFYNRSVLTYTQSGVTYSLTQMLVGNGGASPLSAWKTKPTYSSDWPDVTITGQNAAYDNAHLGFCVVTVSGDNTFTTKMVRLSSASPTDPTYTIHDDASFPSASKIATAGMTSTLQVPSLAFAASAKTTVTAQGAYIDPVKSIPKKTKKETGKIADLPSTFEYQWMDKIVLYNKKLWNPSLTAEENLADHPIQPLDCDMTIAVNSSHVSSEGIAYFPPVITLITNVGSEVAINTPLKPGQNITIRGSYFGIKPPKVYLEYTKNGKIAALMLKADKKLPYEGGKSCMDPTTGESEANYTVPSKWPKGWNEGENHNIVLDNGIGCQTLDFSKIPPPEPPE